jgi:hypothetical protein
MQELDAMTMDNGIRNLRVMELTMDDETRSTRAMEQINIRDNEIGDGLRNSQTMESKALEQWIKGV